MIDVINLPLITSLAAVMVAQLIKVPIYYLSTKKADWGLIFSSGGMPSSHSASMTALATAIGLQVGVESPAFAIATIVAFIVMYDAAGVRRHAGEQAAVLNRLVEDFQKVIQGVIHDVTKGKVHTEVPTSKKLKELLGHQPIEVLMGAVLGIMIALVFHWIFY
jgi:acid phosphatase family membrane protein YuiD